MELKDSLETVYQLLLKKRELSGGLIVQTLGKLVKLEIVGYVPYDRNYDDYLQLLFLEISKDVIVGSTKIRLARYDEKFRKEYIVLPIADAVLLDNDENFILEPSLRVIKYERNRYLRMYRKYWNTINEQKSKEDLIKEISSFSLDERGNVFYKLGQDDYVFYQTKMCEQKAVAISDAFLCLCSYFSPITGCLEYVLKSPKDLIPVLE